MGGFISGILTYNEPSAVDQGRVYTRRLVLLQADSSSLHVFDPFDPISGELIVGQRYEMVLNVLLPRDISYVQSGEYDVWNDPRPQPDGTWWGIIRDLDWWSKEREAYRYAHPEIDYRGYALLETFWGLAVTNHNDINTIAINAGAMAAQVGDVVKWRFLRNDLVAVI